MELQDGRGTVRRHVDSIRACVPQEVSVDTPDSESDIQGPDIPATAIDPTPPPVPATDGAAVVDEPADEPDHTDVLGPGNSTPPSPEHSADQDQESEPDEIGPPVRHSTQSRTNSDRFW